MRIRSLFLLAAAGATLAGCADATPVSPRTPEIRAGVSAQRTVWVDAETVWGLSGGGSGSGGYVKGWATPVGSGTGYEMGDVEANGSDGAYFVEDAGYTGQLDAFRYSGNCTFKWYSGIHQISTAGTIYLADFPSTSSFKLKITCP